MKQALLAGLIALGAALLFSGCSGYVGPDPNTFGRFDRDLNTVVQETGGRPVPHPSAEPER